jgi:hypothetical protein
MRAKMKYICKKFINHQGLSLIALGALSMTVGVCNLLSNEMAADERSISCERRIGGFLTTFKSVHQCLISLQNYEEVCHYKWTNFRGDMGVNGDKNPLRRRQVVNMLRVNLLAKN